MNSRRGLILSGILLLAFFLRLIALDSRPLWYDEAFSVFIAEQDWGRIAAGTAADTMAPLYVALLHLWLPLVGESAFAMRMLSVGFSMLTVALVYCIAEQSTGGAAGKWAAFFAAIAPFQIYYGQELRMYSLLAFTGLVFAYGVMRLERRQRGAVVLVGFSTAAALFTHNLAFVTLLAADVYLLWRRNLNALLRLFVGQVLGVLVSIPWLLFVPTQMQGIERAFWTQPPGIVDLLQMLMMFTTHLPLPDLHLAGALFASLAVAAFAAVALLRNQRSWFYHRTRGTIDPTRLWLSFTLVPPLVMFVISYVVYPVFIPRGLIISSLAYYVLLAMLASRSRIHIRAAIVVAASAIALAALPYLYAAWGDWRRAPFTEANRFLRERYREGDLILHDNKLAFFPMHLYDRALPQEFMADPVGSANDTLAQTSKDAMGLFPVEFDAVIQGHRRVWFVIFQTALDQAEEERHPHGNIARLEAKLDRGQVVSFGDLRIIQYVSR